MKGCLSDDQRLSFACGESAWGECSCSVRNFAWFSYRKVTFLFHIDRDSRINSARIICVDLLPGESDAPSTALLALVALDLRSSSFDYSHGRGGAAAPQPRRAYLENSKRGSHPREAGSDSF